MEAIADKIIKLRDRLKSERSNFDVLYDEVEDYVYPRKKGYKDGEPQGQKEGRKVYDSTPTVASELLAASLNSTLVNPAVKWFSLKSKNQTTADLNELRDILFEEITKETSGFANNFYESLVEVVVYGTCALFVGWDNDGLVFQNIHCRNVYIDESASGRIDTVVREIEMTIRQLEQMFGRDVLPEDIKHLLEIGAETNGKKKVVHAIFPNEKHNRYSKDNVFPYKSVYILEEGKHLLKETGYKEIAIVCARWTKQSGETYGRSPVIYMLPDIKMLNFFMKEMIIAAQLANRPPLLVSDEEEMKIAPIVPNGIIPYSGAMPVPLQTGANISSVYSMIEEIRNRIRKGMYNDLLMFSDQPINMTATEYVRRTEENVKLMSPMVSRLQTELLAPILVRCYGLCKRNGVLSQDAPEIEGIEFITITDQAFKSQKLASMIRLIEASSPFMQIDPQCVNVLNCDTAVREVVQTLGLDNILNDEDKVQEMRAAAQAQMEAQQAKMNEAQMLELQGMSLDNEEKTRNVQKR